MDGLHTVTIAKCGYANAFDIVSYSAKLQMTTTLEATPRNELNGFWNNNRVKMYISRKG